MNRMVLILLGIAAFSAVITYLLWRVFPQVRSVKYLPPLLCLFVGLYYLYLAKTVQGGSGFEDLANAVYSMMLLIGFASGLVTDLILDFLPKLKSWFSE